MGDRSNIAVLQSNRNTDTTTDQVWFYGHWAGERNAVAVRDALRDVPGRWEDESYLARAIWDRFCPETSHGQETGFGISCCLQDNEYLVVVCDVPWKRVYLIKESDLDNGKVPVGYTPAKSWTFEEFSKLADDALPSV